MAGSTMSRNGFLARSRGYRGLPQGYWAAECGGRRLPRLLGTHTKHARVRPEGSKIHRIHGSPKIDFRVSSSCNCGSANDDSAYLSHRSKFLYLACNK